MILIISANPVDEIQPVRMQQENRCAGQRDAFATDEDTFIQRSVCYIDPNRSNYNATILSYVSSNTLKRMRFTAIGTKPCPVPIARRNSSRVRINSERGPLYLVLSTWSLIAICTKT